MPLERGPERPQKCTIVDDCTQIAESGLKPPFESPHLDFPKFLVGRFFWAPELEIREDRVSSKLCARASHTPKGLFP